MGGAWWWHTQLIPELNSGGRGRRISEFKAWATHGDKTKLRDVLGLVVRACDHGTQEAEAGGFHITG